MKRNYRMYEGEDLNTIDCLFTEPCDDMNGVKVIVPVKKSDASTFIKKIKEQLCYFDNVYFDVDNFSHGGEISKNINNDFSIFRNDLFQYSELNCDTSLHLSLDNVYYPIDFQKLGISRIHIPLALRFSLSDGIFPVPNREALIYSKTTIVLILKKIKEFADFSYNLYNENISKISLNVFDLHNYFKNETFDVIFDFGVKFDVTRLEDYSEIELNSVNIEGVSKLNVRNLFSRNTGEKSILSGFAVDYSLSNSGRLTKIISHSQTQDYILGNVKNPRYLFIKSNTKLNLSNLQKDYLRHLNKRIFILVDEHKRRLFKYLELKDYYDLLYLKDCPKSDWRACIQDWQNLVKQVSECFENESTLIPTKEYLSFRKESAKSAKITRTTRERVSGTISIKVAKELERSVYGQNCKFVPNSLNLSTLHKNPYLTVYGKESDKPLLDNLYLAATNQNVEFGIMSPTQIKQIKDLDYHNLIPLEKFMEGNNTAFKKIITSALVSQLKERYEYVFMYKDHFKFISLDFFNKLNTLIKYSDENHYRIDDTLFKTLSEIASKFNLYDLTILDDYLEMKSFLEKHSFLDNLSYNSFRSNYCLVEPDENLLNIYSVFIDVFKYRKIKLNLQHYKTPTPVEEIEVVDFEELTEKIIEFKNPDSEIIVVNELDLEEQELHDAVCVGWD